MLSRCLWLAYIALAVAAQLSSASSMNSATSLKLHSRQQEISSSRSSLNSGSSVSRPSSSSARPAGAVRQLMAAEQRKCSQYAAQVNNHQRNGYRLAVQKYRNPQQCPALCKTYESSVPSGVFTVRCNLASCTCTATPVGAGAKVMFGITDGGRFSFTALYPPQCTPDMSAKCSGLYEWCRNC